MRGDFLEARELTRGRKCQKVGTGSEWPESSATGADDEVRAVTGTVSHWLSKSACESSWKVSKSLDSYPVCLINQCILYWAMESVKGKIYFYLLQIHAHIPPTILHCVPLNFPKRKMD